MKELRFAVLGAGFWAQFQLAAWSELTGAKCVAIYNRTRPKAEALAERFAIPRVYDDPRQLLEQEQLDFVDIITDASTHAPLTKLAAEHRVGAISQKPLATTLDEARAMIEACRRAGVPLLVHENWRWQRPLRELKQVLDEERVGQVFRARIQYSSSFPVFENQPFLKELERFILTDMGTHILDVARYLFGEASLLFCRTNKVHREIRGEDVATVMMAMGRKRGEFVTVTCEISYASRLEHDRFPEAFVLVEGDRGSVELAPDCWLRVTTAEGTWARQVRPPRYSWADPQYDLVHASIVPCNANLLAALRGEGQAETTGEDNLKTLELVFAAYESAETGRAVPIKHQAD